MKMKVYVYLYLLLTLVVLSVLTVGFVSAAEEKNESVAEDEDDGEKEEKGEKGEKSVDADAGEEEDDDGEKESKEGKGGKGDEEEDDGESDSQPSERPMTAVETANKPTEPVRIMTFPKGDEGGLTSVALSCFGLVRLFGVAIFGRGPYLISVHGLRRFASILAVAIFLLAYNSDSLANPPAETMGKALHYARHFCGRFMWSALFTALFQFFGMFGVQQMYDPFMAAVMTPKRMKSMAALYEIMIGFRHFMVAFLEYGVPFIWIPVNILMYSLCRAQFPATDFTPVAYCVGFLLWLLREVAFQKMFVTSFFVMTVAEIVFIVSWIHLAATTP